jgi:WD40 repeat protein
MTNDETIRELLAQWEDFRDQGIDIAPEQLCRESPHLIEPLRRKIRVLAAFDRITLNKRDAGRRDDDAKRRLPLLPGYEISEELGRGGMGVVYRGLQVALKRTVAIKMILAGPLSDPSIAARFRVEAEASARLQHPNIVPIFEIGDHDGQPFLVLEYMAGGRLDSRLRDGPMSPRVAAAMVEPLARAAQAMHDRGILHRDLKPANVLLNDEGTPKISDFGLAKLRDRSPDELGYQTASEAVLGTPSYMAPEQASGKARDVGPSADAYALGGILYASLTGRPPFQGDSMAQILAQVTRDPPVAPRSLNPAVPADLETICLKCLRKDLAKRYGSARELADDLGRFLRGEPIKARPMGRWEKAIRWGRRYPATATASVGLILMLLMGAIVGLLFGLSQARHRREAEIRVAEGSRDRALALWTQHEEGESLHWLAQALKQAPPDADDLIDELRRQFDAATRLTPKLADSFTLEGQRFTSVHLARNGRAVFASATGRLYHWDLTQDPTSLTSREIQTDGVAFSDDGQRVVLALGGEVSLLDAATGVVRTKMAVPRKVSVVAVAMDRQGQTVMARDEAGGVHVWDANDGRLIASPVTAGATDAVLGSDDKRMAIVEKDIVHVWELRPVRRLFTTEPSHGGKTVAFGPDGSCLVVGSGATITDGEAVIWDVPSGRRRATLPHRFPVRTLAFSVHGSLILTGGDDAEVRVWNAKTGRLATGTLQHPDLVRAAAIAPDGDLIAVGCASGAVLLWDRVSGRRAGPTLTHSGSIERIAFAPDGQLLVATEQAISRWRLPQTPVRRHPAPVDELFIRGEVAWTFARNGNVFRFALADDPSSLPQPFPDWAVRTMTVSRDGRSIASLDQDGKLRLRHADGRRARVVPAESPGMRPLGFAQDGTILVTTTGTEARLWDVETLRPVGDMMTATSFVNFVLSPTGNLLAGGTSDGQLHRWDTRTGKPFGAIGQIPMGQAIRWLAWSPDSGTLAIAGEDGLRGVRAIHRFSATGESIGQPIPLSETVRALAFSLDGLGLAVVVGRTVTWIDLPSGQQRWVTADLPGNPASLAFSPDGRYVATGILSNATNQSVWVWSTATGRPISPPLRHPGAVLGLEFGPDGKHLLTRCIDGGLRQWAMPR